MTESFNDVSAQNAKHVKKITLLHNEYKSLQDRHAVFYQLNQLSTDSDDLFSFYQKMHKAIASIMDADHFYIAMYDQTLETIEFVYHHDAYINFPDGPLPYSHFDDTILQYVIDKGKPLFATASVIEKEKHTGVIGFDGNDWLGVPLINNGQVIGLMVVQNYSDEELYEEQDLELLTFTSQHIVTAIIRLQDRERLQKAVNARTHELMQQIRERERSELLQESLFKISELTNDPSLNINQFYTHVHNIVGQLVSSQNFFIARHDKENSRIVFSYYVDSHTADLSSDFQSRLFSNGYTEYVIQQAKSVLLNQDDMLALYKEGVTRAPEPETISWLGVPLIHSGDTLGAMVVQSYSKNITFNEQDAEILKFVSQHICSAIKRRELAEIKKHTQSMLEHQVKIRTLALEEEIKQRKQVEGQLKYAALHDSLTGLANRTIFVDLLNHAIACSRRNAAFKFAVLFLDLDRFKNVNDSLGHYAGDKLLKIVAKELDRMVRGKDTVARFGGDEFVILIEDLEENKEALEIAQRITDLLALPFSIDNQPVFIGTSIGLLFNDSRYDNADTMLRDADTAMYHAKDKGRGRYEIFDSSMHKKVQNALSLEMDMRAGIANKEFLPYFQPIVRLSDNKTIGFEALVRWKSKSRGFVYPNDFIPLAEETNLVLDIDFMVFENSCRYLKAWQDKYNCDDMYISCNLYCNHFFSTTLAEDLEKVINRVGIKTKNIRIELTERALLENTHMVLANMKALKKLGIKILLDDFGTGYSSLSYLHRFPIDVLKIDRSFIINAYEHDNHRAIIKTIIDLATNLNMETVGEGIENLADAELLNKMECVYGQGYYFAKAMHPDSVINYLIEHTQ